MLTFEYDADSILEITFDADGLKDLMDILSKLQQGDHDHLSTHSWGGYPLTEDFPNPDLTPIHQVTVQYVGDEA